MSLPIQSSAALRTTALAWAGALLPAVALIRSHGWIGLVADLGWLKVIWGLAPFLLFPLAARRARRLWVRRLILVLALVALAFSVVGYLLLLPRRTGASADLLWMFLPVWQWPMALLAGVLSVFVPSEEEERLMSDETGP